MKASILAVGTELTTGQIINKNASSLSEKLKAFGLQTSMHLTVPDQRPLMFDALQYLESRSELIFITGGLGPTSDDFTREVVADWLKSPLQFDQKSWDHIVSRLTARGFQVREIQKQQCYFPKNSEILQNKEGTANAFKFTREIQGRTQHIFVLPGPPREIESVFKDHIQAWLQEQTKNLNKRITKAWDTLGVGESDVALLVEETLARFPKSDQLEVGYRVHLPYVEVKITYDENKKDLYHETILQVNEKLKKITITRNFEDVAKMICQKLTATDFTFYDFLSQGYLHTRLNTSLKIVKQWSFKQSSQTEITPDFFQDEDSFLALLPYDENVCLVIGSYNSKRFQKTIEAPMKSSLMSERRLQYFSEMALVELCLAMGFLI